MFYQPATGSMWDPSVIWHEGQYYLFAMRGNLPIQPDRKNPFDGVWMATSPDGVHWSDWGSVIEDDVTVYKMFVARCGDRFTLNHGSFTNFDTPQERQDLLKFFVSTDLIHWEYLEDSQPDPRWYSDKRWDHMYMIPKVEGAPQEGFWGYCVGHPRDDFPYRSYGMLQSVDGLHWEVLPPPLVEWGETPQCCFEVGGCERIGDKYYLIGGWMGYMGDYGYSMYTLVGDSATGPFRPDLPAFRLCGASGYPGMWGVQFLASFCRGNGELLLSNYLYSQPDTQEDVWFTPLKKAVVDSSGHLRMGYWSQNDLAKGAPLPIDAGQLSPLYPRSRAQPTTQQQAQGALIVLESVTAANERTHDQVAIALLGEHFDPNQGYFLECTLKAAMPGAHWRPTYAGFYLEEAAGEGSAILLEVGHPAWRRSHVGRLTLNDQIAFASQDVTGPGCATATGLEDGAEHRLRLLVRKNIFELYVDDLLFQTFTTRPLTGRVGLLVQNGRAEWANMNAWQMNFV